MKYSEAGRIAGCCPERSSSVAMEAVRNQEEHYVGGGLTRLPVFFFHLVLQSKVQANA